MTKPFESDTGDKIARVTFFTSFYVMLSRFAAKHL
jgi:hypothetical protein